MKTDPESKKNANTDPQDFFLLPYFVLGKYYQRLKYFYRAANIINFRGRSFEQCELITKNVRHCEVRKL
jgi:hypothetical protein